MPAKTQHPRITEDSVKNPVLPEDDGTVSAEELAKDPNAQDYLPNNLSPVESKHETTEGEITITPRTVNNGTDNSTNSGSPETKEESTDAAKVENPQPQIPALDPEQLIKNGGEGLAGLFGLIAQMQQQMMDMQAQMNKKVDSERVDPKVFLNSGASTDDTKRWESKADRTARIINAQPKMSIFIPLEGKEKIGKATLPVTINGHRWNVPKGIYVEVPSQVAKEAMNSLNQTAQALESPFRLDNAPDDRRRALGGSSGVVTEG